MSYENALKDTDTFVPMRDAGQFPDFRMLESEDAGAVVAGGQVKVHVRGGSPFAEAKSLVSTVFLYHTRPSEIRPSAKVVWWGGETWSAPCVWMASIRDVIDVRPALDAVARLEVRDRLGTLRLRAREKGLHVVPVGESAGEVAEREETHEMMRLLQADSLLDRD